MVSPRFRKAISWKRLDSVSKSKWVVSNISASAQKVTVVPLVSVGSSWDSGAWGTPWT